jgi:hypothetical protein
VPTSRAAGLVPPTPDRVDQGRRRTPSPAASLGEGEGGIRVRKRRFWGRRTPALEVGGARWRRHRQQQPVKKPEVTVPIPQPVAQIQPRRE